MSLSNLFAAGISMLPVSESQINEIYSPSQNPQTLAVNVMNRATVDTRLQCATLNGLPVYETKNKNGSVGCHFQTPSSNFQMEMEPGYCPSGIGEVAVSGSKAQFKSRNGLIGNRYQSRDYAGVTFNPAFKGIVNVSGAKKVGANKLIDGSVICE